MKHNKICSSLHKAPVLIHSITYTFKSATLQAPGHARQKVKTSLLVGNKGPVFSAEEELGQI